MASPPLATAVATRTVVFLHPDERRLIVSHVDAPDSASAIAWVLSDYGWQDNVDDAVSFVGRLFSEN